MIELIGLFVGGLMLVTLGSDSLLKGTSGLAQSRGAGGYAAGLAMVVVGSSVSEVAIALAALFKGHYDLALGTVIGSSIANFGLIIGVAALVKPLSVGFRFLLVALPMVAGAAIALMLMSHNGTIGYWDGAVLLLTVILFGWAIKRSSAQENESVRKEMAYVGNTQLEVSRNLVRVALGLGFIGFGAHLTVDKGMSLAESLGMSELLFGLTVLAIGSAIPELTAAIVSAARGHGNVVVGSAVSSSAINLMLVLGLMAVIKPVPVAHSLVYVELPVLIAFCVAFYPMLRGDAVVSRREGGILLAAFVGVVAFQFFVAR